MLYQETFAYYILYKIFYINLVFFFFFWLSWLVIIHYGIFLTIYIAQGTPNYNRFRRCIYSNSNSVDNSVKKLIVDLAAENVDFVGCFILILHKSQKWREQLNTKGESLQRLDNNLTYR